MSMMMLGMAVMVLNMKMKMHMMRVRIRMLLTMRMVGEDVDDGDGVQFTSVVSPQDGAGRQFPFFQKASRGMEQVGIRQRRPQHELFGHQSCTC